MDVRLSCRGYALTVTLGRRWRLLAFIWANGRTGAMQIGPLAIVVRMPRWDGDQR